MLLLLLACGYFSLVGISQALTVMPQRSRQERVMREKRAEDGSRVYKHQLYEGFFYGSAWWLTYAYDPEPVCIATYISIDVAITPCECVTTLQNPLKDIVTVKNHTAWYTWKEAGQDPLIGGPLKVADPADYSLTAYFPRIPTNANYRLSKITPHPQCGSFYTYNIAMVSTVDKLPDIQIAWVLTKSDALFSNAFSRVIAGQAVSGRCVAPYYSIKSGFNNARPEFVYEFNVEIQNWDACRKTVCPDWDRRVPLYEHNQHRIGSSYDNGIRRPLLPPYAPEICLDRVRFTKYCVRVKKPIAESCTLKPGTPVYCEAGDLNGLFGFLVNATFGCVKIGGTDNDLVFQGLNIAIDWLENELEDRVNKDEEYVTPRWMSELRKTELSKSYEFLEPYEIQVGRWPFFPTPPGKKVPDKIHSVFSDDDVAETIVNYYYDGEKLCEATQIAPSHFILPCYCVAFQYEEFLRDNPPVFRFVELHNNFSDPYKGTPEALDRDSFRKRAKKARPMAVGLMRVRWALTDRTGKHSHQCTEVCKPNPDDNPKYTIVDGIELPYCYCVTAVSITKTCDSHFLDDYATITTVQPVKNAKTAWITTSYSAYFRHALDIFSESNIIAGDCFMVRFNYTDAPIVDPKSNINVKRVKPEYVRVNMAHWDLCRPLVCPPTWFKIDKQDKCWNAHVVKNPDDAYNLWMERPADISRMCITSYNYRFMCDIVTNGAPVFCKSNLLRGLVGFISTFHTPACDKKLSEKAYERAKSTGVVSAVMMRLDRFFSMDISKEALIRKIERSSVGQQKPLNFGAAFLILPVLCFLAQLAL